MQRSADITLVILLLIIFAPLVAAHAPEFPSHNESLSAAAVVSDPTKSWAIYSHLHEGMAVQYYLLPMHRGDNIVVQLISPRASTDNGFLPALALMGTGIQGNDPVPSFVEVPPGAGVKRVDSVLPPDLDYEPFSPSAYYALGNLSVIAPQEGDYYLAVFDEGGGGNYCIAVGSRESFTLGEWLLIPFDSINIYLWEGQSPVMALATPAATIAVGLIAILLLSRRRDRTTNLLWALAVFVGVLMIASGLSMLIQMLWSLSQSGPDVTIAVTLVFAILPILVGAWALRIGNNPIIKEEIGWKTRLSLLLIAGLGLLLWAGYLIGPVLAVVAAVLPNRWLERRRE